MKGLKTILNGLLLLTMAVGTMSCQGLIDAVLGNDDVPVSTDVPSAKKMLLEVMGERYEVALPASEPLNLRTLTNEFDITVKVLNASDFSSVTIGGKPLAGGVCTLRAPEVLNASTYIDVNYATGSQQGSIKLRTYPKQLFTMGSTGEGVIPGDFYLSFIFQPLIMKVDNQGRLLYYRFEPTEANGTFQEQGFWDFKKHVFSGKTYYSYHAPDPAFKDRAFTGYVPGMRILMDEHYVPVDTIHALASSDGYLPAGSPLDGHDFYFFSPTHWIASASYVEREVNGVKRAVGYLQEVDGGKVVFDWWSTDHPEMLDWAEAMTTFDTSYDYVHFNSVDVMPDGNWLLSFRAINARQPGLTRTLRLKVQEDANSISVSSKENLIEGTPSYFTQACGALLDFGTQGFVVGWGWSTETGNCNRLVSEYAPDGSLRFELHHLLNNPMSVNPSYRCVKCE